MICFSFASKLIYQVREVIRQGLYHLYINLACLFVCLGVCLFVFNKRQNGWTDRAKIFCGTSRDHREVLWMIKNFRKCVLKVFNFVKKKFLKIREFFLNIHKIFFFVLKCQPKELHVHNLNRRSALKA